MGIRGSRVSSKEASQGPWTEAAAEPREVGTCSVDVDLALPARWPWARAPVSDFQVRLGLFSSSLVLSLEVTGALKQS